MGCDRVNPVRVDRLAAYHDIVYSSFAVYLDKKFIFICYYGRWYSRVNVKGYTCNVLKTAGFVRKIACILYRHFQHIKYCLTAELSGAKKISERVC